MKSPAGLVKIVKDEKGGDLIFAYLHLHSIFEAEHTPSDAIASVYHALAIMIKLDPVPENSIAGIYNDLANMHYYLHNSDLPIGRAHRNPGSTSQQLYMIPET